MSVRGGWRVAALDLDERVPRRSGPWEAYEGADAVMQAGNSCRKRRA
ncbi:hypothetical protein BX264_7080 [Streptomyces sp. 2333.5]|nr:MULTISPECIES: hypothetical protein [unclassified Streptomyces]PJJ06548.1 hypothetical protein BX264_7080 [Streptomyces sp. 2333.5]SEE96775.1 hypothetical protein SAMN05428943_7180 [Streptomyces sp. 2314.4]SEF10943.1 hypothetical protein SAMN05428942_7180 [Streptomyces sp. 2112.2]